MSTFSNSKKLLFMSIIYMSKTSINQYNSNNITIYFQKIQKKSTIAILSLKTKTLSLYVFYYNISVYLLFYGFDKRP